MNRSDPMESVFPGVALGVVVIAAAIALMAPPLAPAAKQAPPEPFVVALQAPPPELAPEIPPPPRAAKPPPPTQQPPPKAAPTPPPMPAPPLPAVLPQAPPPPLQPPAPPMQATVTPPPTAAAAPTRPSPANAEASYTGKLRAYIRTITEYPTSGDARRTRPEGAVIVRFALSRAGQLRDAAVERKSSSPILDKQALAIVRGGTYPAMPKEIWPDEQEHAFTVTVEFVSP